MIDRRQTHPFAMIPARNGFAALALAAAFLAGPAFAGEKEAEAALSRAGVKIETVTPQAGRAGDDGDQSFNMARERLANAHIAQKSNHYDTAEMLADEASLLADLTGEKATLAALRTSQDNLRRSISVPSPAL